MPQVQQTGGFSYDAILNGSIPQQSLAAQHVLNTVGNAVDYGAVRNNHTMQVNAAAGVTGGVVTLLTSLDGVNYITTATTITASAAGGFQATLANTPARFVNAKITTAISGGGAPNVDVWLAGV